jgi:hypothetical protein
VKAVRGRMVTAPSKVGRPGEALREEVSGAIIVV